MAISRRKDELLMPASSSSKKDEPEAKKRRQDMDDEEGKMFDNWIDEIKQKRSIYFPNLKFVMASAFSLILRYCICSTSVDELN
jgi:hypothetical protein